MREQIESLLQAMRSESIDAFIAYKPENTRYLSGFCAKFKGDGQAVVDAGGVWLYANIMNKEQALAQAHDARRLTVMEYMTTLGQYLAQKGYKKVAIEENVLTVQEFDNLKTHLPATEFVYGTALLNAVKRHKTAEQLALFRKSCAITEQIWERVLTFAEPGVTERQIERLILDLTAQLGAEGPTFTPIVVSGERASQPHGQPTDKPLAMGDFLTVDMGVIYEGCPSDFTRTVVIGKASDKQREIYEIVRTAQQKAQDEIMPGMTGRQADKIARDVIEAAGYGQYYPHGLGHGLDDGFRLSQVPALDLVLHEGMIFTIEPGVYIEGFGGVRIEDMVHLTKDGCVSMYTATKSLIELT